MRSFITVVPIWFVFLFAVSCSDSPSGISETKTLLKINLTDAPGEFEEVNITFSEVSALFGNQWIIISNQSQTFDLLTLSNGRTALLGEAEVEAGRYQQIRLKISGGEVVTGGTSYPLTVPSGAQTGLKFGPAFTIEPGITYELIVDFDASRSIHATGPPGNPTNFILTPFIRVIAQEPSGAISGQVTNFEHLPTAYAIAGGDTVTSTSIDKVNGNFLLAFLPEGVYSVAISDTLGNAYTESDITVTKGETNNLGQITLK